MLSDPETTPAASILPMSVDDLGFSIGGLALLSHISFSLPKGGITAMIGPNGAGKSLTLRLCHGLLQPTSGAIYWQQDKAGRIGRHSMVFQRPVMLRRSAEANIAHAVSARNRHGRTAAETLDRFDLIDIAARPARQLSGGEQQRLALARAWALDPELLFLDEPTAHLDPGATRRIEAEILRLAEEGVTILMTTHDFGQARRLASRILFLNRGRLVEDAAAPAFLNQPSTEEGQRFLRGDLI